MHCLRNRSHQTQHLAVMFPANLLTSIFSQKQWSCFAHLLRRFQGASCRAHVPVGEEPMRAGADLQESHQAQPCPSEDFREPEAGLASDSLSSPHELQSSLKETGQLMLESFRVCYQASFLGSFSYESIDPGT